MDNLGSPGVVRVVSLDGDSPVTHFEGESTVELWSVLS